MLSGSEKITKKMRLVDAELARDLFLLHAQQLRQHRRDWQRQQRAASAAPQLKDDAVGSAASSVALQQPSQLRAPLSAGLVRTRSVEALAAEAQANAEDRSLAAKLVSIALDDETHRGKCSVWQVGLHQTK